MVKIQIDPIARRIVAEGHAGYAPVGQDIVCSAVSVLTQTLQEYISDVNGFSVSDNGERWSVGCLPETKEEIRRTGIAFDMTLVGLEMLENTYPEFVSVDIV